MSPGLISLLADRTLRRGVHRSTAEIETDIAAYIDATNANLKPFRWAKSADDILGSISRFRLHTLENTQISESGY